MNRYNFGNVMTNAMQIGSTGVFTGTRSLGNASNVLNNFRNKNVNVDKIMENSSISPQSDELIEYINNNYVYKQKRGPGGKFEGGGMFVLKEKEVEENKNADV